MKYENFLRFMSRMGVLVYLLVASLNSYIFMVEDNYDLLLFDELSIFLHMAFVISIITSIFICTTSSRYRISFILIMLSSMFLILCLFNLFNRSNPWYGDGIKMASYNLMSNFIIITSIIHSYRKYINYKRVSIT